MARDNRTKNRKQFQFVLDLMRDGKWRSLRDAERDLQYAYAQSSISARFREFHNFGLVIEKHKENGVWVEVLTAPKPVQQQQELFS